ncbi:MarR family transcriptional regulator [Bradyrhizobium sp. Ai1a-2]|uniref:MarR family transcriptional regulator n=1 Tax=Bradyrhizobium sp. Ai1a-2 TaxID=196490 RepID=UPI00047FDE5B|nr:MarR family transcriptional regulator [Bradyrhizobium sp. Ai1a-2]
MFKLLSMAKGHYRSLLAVAASPEPPNAEQVADLIGCRSSSAKQYLAALDRRGLLRRIRHGCDDIDEAVFVLTDAGADLFGRMPQGQPTSPRSYVTRTEVGRPSTPVA